MSVAKLALTQLTNIANALKGAGRINVPVSSCVLGTDGSPLAVFADNAASAPGLTLVNGSSYAIRWNNNATQVAVAFNGPLPLDLDPSFPLVWNFVVSKTGATVGDATTMTLTYKNNAVGALHDAGADVGGVSGAINGALAAKTTSRLQRTIAAANLATPPGFFALTFKPSNGTLGTDDFLVHGLWGSYTMRQSVA